MSAHHVSMTRSKPSRPDTLYARLDIIEVKYQICTMCSRSFPLPPEGEDFVISSSMCMLCAHQLAINLQLLNLENTHGIK